VAGRRIPQRSCIGCGLTRGKKELVRIVRTPEGVFALDPTGKAAGRGAYLCPHENCLQAAIKRKSFHRAFRQNVEPTEAAALTAQIAHYLERESELAAARDEDRAPTGDSDTTEKVKDTS